MLYVVATFLVLFLLTASGLLLLFYREALGQRLAGILGSGSESSSSLKVRQWAESLGVAAASVQKVVPKSEKEVSLVQKRLARAGFRKDSSVNLLYAAKALTPMLLCVVVTATGFYRFSPIFVFGLAVTLGYLLPDFVLDHLIKARGDALRLGLPELLDLLVVCLEAGLSLDQALLRATDELRSTFPAISDELGLVLLEVRAGRPRVDAWRTLADRTNVSAIRQLVSIFVQSDQFGTGISRTLRTHSEVMRTRRRQHVEELASKTAVKLVFPLLLFIFPSIWVVSLGPAIITIVDNLKL